MRRGLKQAEKISEKPEERGYLRRGQEPEQVHQRGSRGSSHRRGRNRQRRKSRRHRRWRRNRGRPAERGHETEPGRAVPGGSRVRTGAIGTLSGRKSTRRALAAVMILGTEITPGRELTEGGVMAEVLTPEALRRNILGFQVLHDDTKMKKAGDGS